MKCANCGNDDPRYLHDEGDTFYCSKCCHRTQTATGQDDLIVCPFCGRFRDRKAYTCLWCGSTIGQNPPPSKEYFEELDKEISAFEDRLDSSNIRYWKIRGKRNGS